MRVFARESGELFSLTTPRRPLTLATSAENISSKEKEKKRRVSTHTHTDRHTDRLVVVVVFGGVWIGFFWTRLTSKVDGFLLFCHSVVGVRETNCFFFFECGDSVAEGLGTFFVSIFRDPK